MFCIRGEEDGPEEAGPARRRWQARTLEAWRYLTIAIKKSQNWKGKGKGEKIAEGIEPSAGEVAGDWGGGAEDDGTEVAGDLRFRKKNGEEKIVTTPRPPAVRIGIDRQELTTHLHAGPVTLKTRQISCRLWLRVGWPVA